MTVHDRRRTDPVAARVYTLPIVREVPSRPGGAAGDGTQESAQPPVYAADSHAW